MYCSVVCHINQLPHMFEYALNRQFLSGHFQMLCRISVLILSGLSQKILWGVTGWNFYFNPLPLKLKWVLTFPPNQIKIWRKIYENST